VDTSTLKVDSTNNRVGIGTASPGSALDVRFSTNPAVDNAVPTNALRVFTSVAQAVDVGGQIGLGGLYDATTFQAFANISGKKENGTSGNNAGYLVIGTCDSGGTMAERYRIDSTGISTWSVAGTTAMTLNSTGLGIGVVPANNKFQVAGNVGLPNSCTASGETSGVFSIDVANLLTLTGANWRQCSLLLVYSGVDTGLGNSTVLQTVVTLQGLSTYGTISKNDIVGTASVAVSNDTTTGARITVTVPTGNAGSVYVMLLGGAGATTRPSITINA